MQKRLALRLCGLAYLGAKGGLCRRESLPTRPAANFGALIATLPYTLSKRSKLALKPARPWEADRSAVEKPNKWRMGAKPDTTLRPP